MNYSLRENYPKVYPNELKVKKYTVSHLIMSNSLQTHEL